MKMTTNPREAYTRATKEVLDESSNFSIRKYCQWLELEYGHELARRALAKGWNGVSSYSLPELEDNSADSE